MRMPSERVRNGIAAGVAVVATVTGLAAPAFAGERHDVIDNRLDGWASANWTDHDSDDQTRVTIGWCTREFRAQIRKVRNLRPDPVVGSEWINCLDYDDAVRSEGTPAAGTYHYDINGMDGSCFCDYRTTAGAWIYW